MKRIAILLLAGLTAAAAQPAPPTESVTVTGLKDAPQAVVDHFVQSFSKPAYLTGKMGRWENGVCPVTTGLAPNTPPSSAGAFASWRHRYMRRWTRMRSAEPISRSSSPPRRWEI